MIAKFIVWTHSLLAETVTALCINTVAIVGTLAIWSNLDMLIKITIGIDDAVIAVTSLFWLRAKTKKNNIETEEAPLRLEKERFEFEMLKKNTSKD